MARGVRARSMRPVFPTITFPNHYSLVTGLYPEHHGIVENSFFDPVRNASFSFRNFQSVSDGTWYGGEPIWVTAERQGMVSACFFWPGSEADIKGIRPTFWNKYDGSVPERTADRDRARLAPAPCRTPAARHHALLQRRRLCVAQDADWRFRRGRCGAAVDTALGVLLDGLDRLESRDRVLLLLTSDHGMADTAAARIVQLGDVIDTTGVRAGFSGPVTGLHVSPEAGTAMAVRDRINAKLQHGRAYLRQEVPERHHFRDTPRAGDVVVIMDEGWLMATSIINRGLIQRDWGEHGWDPDLPSMKAIFLLAGPGIRGGVTIPEVENVDVYPLMTELLGLQPATGIDGQPGKIRSMLK